MQESCSSKSKACQLACRFIVIIFITIIAIVAPTATSSSILEHDSNQRMGIGGEPCAEGTPCPWNIPPIPATGCCPRESGQSCDPENQELCNSEFGLRCVEWFNESLPTDGFGICKGPLNLTVTAIAQNQVTLEWIDFAPPDYPYEFAVLLIQGSYHRDISRWEIRDCGADPRCVLRRLTPATDYLVKVAVWEDVRAMTFGRTTETIVVTTKAVDYCEGNVEGREYEVGKSFIHEQEENCTCLPAGEFQCHPLCPHGFPEMDEGCQAVRGEDCQYNITCDLPAGFEESEEELCSRYPEGTELRFECRVCKCENERLKCAYADVCNVLSPRPACQNIKEIKIPGECCPEWECEDVCHHENKSYSAGKLFQSQACGLCQCQPSGVVECVSNCPPVEMVPPSPACPSPHIKRTGCCDTLHCFNAESDLFSFVRNLAVLYTTSTGLTLLFDTKPMCEVDGRPSYCNYKIQYANTSKPGEPHGWRNRYVQPVDVVHDGILSGFSHPIDVLTKNTAIVINGRAVVTLTGLYPSTEFYVVVTRIEEVREDMEADIIDNDLSRSLLVAARVVVKTRPLQNVTSCFYSGRVVLHNEIVSKACNQVCMCRLGQVTCQSTCSDESIVIAASVSCPKPSLEKMEGECCPKWRCNPTVSGCHYKNTVLRPGQVTSDGCVECVCTNTTVQCVSLCPPTGVSPRNGCVLTNHSGHCCPQWSCPIEKSTPVAVERSVLLKFLGSCQNPVSNFKKSLSKEIVSHVTKLLNCSDVRISSSLCHGLSAFVECSKKSFQQGDRDKRSAEDDLEIQFIHVLVSVRRNFSSEEDQEIVFRAGQDLQKLLNSSFSVRLPSGHHFQSSAGTRLRRPVYICSRGFLYKNGHCVLSEIDMIGTQWTEVPVTPVDISQQSVTFQWPPLRDSIQKHIATLHIKYRPTGVITWTSTKTMPAWRTSITVSGLDPGTSFVGALVAVGHGDDDVDGGTDRDTQSWILGDISFHTLSLAVDQALSSIDLTAVSVTANTIVLYWGHLTKEMWTQVQVASIVYWASSSNAVRTLHVENKGIPFTTIQGLSSSTEYTSQMTVVLSSGQTVRSQALRITTLPGENCDHGSLLPILIACCGTVLLVLVVFLVLMCWRGKNKSKNTGIENKLYGVSLENNTTEAPTTNTGTTSTS